MLAALQSSTALQTGERESNAPASVSHRNLRDQYWLGLQMQVQPMTPQQKVAQRDTDTVHLTSKEADQMMREMGQQETLIKGYQVSSVHHPLCTTLPMICNSLDCNIKELEGVLIGNPWHGG